MTNTSPIAPNFPHFSTETPRPRKPPSPWQTLAPGHPVQRGAEAVASAAIPELNSRQITQSLREGCKASWKAVLMIDVEGLQKQNPTAWHWTSGRRQWPSRCRQLWSIHDSQSWIGGAGGGPVQAGTPALQKFLARLRNDDWSSPCISYNLRIWQEYLFLLSVCVGWALSCSIHFSVHLTKPLFKEPSGIMTHVSGLGLTIGVTFWFKFCFNLPDLCPPAHLPYRALSWWGSCSLSVCPYYANRISQPRRWWGSGRGQGDSSHGSEWGFTRYSFLTEATI